MATGSFAIGNQMQGVTIPVEHVKGTYDGLRRHLNIFVDFKLKVNHRDKNTSIDFFEIHATLLLRDKICLSSLSAPLAINLFGAEVTTGIWLNFLLDDASIHMIQKTKEGGDIKLKVEFLLSVLQKESLDLIEDNTTWGLKQVVNLRGEVPLIIPKSHWVEKLLTELGYQSFRLIEVPLTHHSIEEAYDDIISEFDKAEAYFTQGDYNKSIAHCRHTLDALSRNLVKIKKSVDSETNFKWLSNIDQATFTWIDEVNKSLSSIASKPHHPGLKKDFSRIEAESIYLVTLGLMNYVGQFGSRTIRK